MPWLVPTVLALAGCTGWGDAYPTDAYVRHLVVHGMLVAGQEDQEILVEYTRDLREGYFKGLTPASDAHVAITGDGATFSFEESPDSVGVYRAAFIPQAGQRYRLRVESTDGAVATSHTVIPGSPRITVPAADTTVRRDVLGQDVTLHWTSAQGAGYVIVPRHPYEDGPTGLYAELMILETTVRSDTTAVFTVGGLGRNQHGQRLNIAAVDSNYARFVAVEPFTTVPRSAARSSLDGAYGLFGSVAYSNTRTVLIAE